MNKSKFLFTVLTFILLFYLLIPKTIGDCIPQIVEMMPDGYCSPEQRVNECPNPNTGYCGCWCSYVANINSRNVGVIEIPEDPCLRWVVKERFPDTEGAYNGYTCEVFGGVWYKINCDLEDLGKWDASENQCVKCEGRKKVGMIGDATGIFKADIGRCSGDPDPCSTYNNNEGKCGDAGCTYDEDDGSCDPPGPNPCNTYSDRVTCKDYGCDWEGKCSSACGEVDSRCYDKYEGDFCGFVDWIKEYFNSDCQCEKLSSCTDDNDCQPANYNYPGEPGYVCDPDSGQCVTCDEHHAEALSSNLNPNWKCESAGIGTTPETGPFTTGKRNSCCTAEPACDEEWPRSPDHPNAACDEYCKYAPIGVASCYNEGQPLSQTGVTTGGGKPTTVRLWGQDREGYLFKCEGYDSGECYANLTGSLTSPCSNTGDQNIDWDEDVIQGIKVYVKDIDCGGQSYKFEIKNAAGENLFKQEVGCSACELPACPGSGWGECGRVIIDNVFVPSTNKTHYARCWDNDDVCKIYVDGTERASIGLGGDTGEVDVDQYMSSGSWHRITIENYQTCQTCSYDYETDNCLPGENGYRHQMTIKDPDGEIIWESHSDDLVVGEANPYTDFSPCCGSRYIVNLFWCKGCVDGDNCRNYGDTWTAGEEECTCDDDGRISCVAPTTEGLFVKTMDVIKGLGKIFINYLQ